MNSASRLGVRIAIESAVIFGLLTLVVYLTNWDLGYFGTILLAPAVVLAWQMQRLIQEPDAGPRPTPRPVPVSLAFRRFQVLRERVRWGMTSTDYFDSAVRPIVTELLEDRLLRHHGIDRARQPAVVKAELARVLGELEDLRAPPEVAALSQAITRLEEL
jgi:hypothetical protein